jgi:hypothetical protein
VCGRTYCAEHRDLAKYLAMPDRRDTIEAPTREEVDILTALLDDKERRLEAWRHVARNGSRMSETASP